jgi:hypothetical protein
MAEQEDHSKVRTEHPEYRDLQEKREVIEALRAGTRALRDKNKIFLPQFDAETDNSYTWRKDTATLLNLYLKTEETFAGLTCQTEIELSSDVPAEIVVLTEDIDNCGNHLDVFAKQLFLDSLDGASCFLVDYPPQPKNEEGETIVLTALSDKTRRVFWKEYKQSQVINWKQRPNPQTKEMEYSLIVLKESADISQGLFDHDKAERYYVLFLDEMNVCRFRLYEERKNADNKAVIELIDSGTVFQSGKKPFNKIPFVVCGDLCAAPPLMDIADKNIEHFQTYSDYKSLIHKTCVPIPYTKGASEIKVLSGDNLVEVPEGGDFGFAEVTGDSLNVIRQCLEDIKAEIGLLGLTAVVNDGQTENVTATEVLINSIEETSFLSTRARALKDAIEQGFIFTAQYMGLKQGGSIELGTAWRNARMQAEQQQLAEQNMNSVNPDNSKPAPMETVN